MSRLFPNRFTAIGLLLLLTFAGAAAGQVQTESIAPADTKPAEVRKNALQQLGLSREQLAEIRKINQVRKPLMETAQERLRVAKRALDDSIYSDSVSEEVFQARLRDFHAAQTETARIRFVNEFAVRRVLTAEQLGRFRQIRDRFDRARAGRAGSIIPERKPRFPKLKRSAPAPR